MTFCVEPQNPLLRVFAAWLQEVSAQNAAIHRMILSLLPAQEIPPWLTGLSRGGSVTASPSAFLHHHFCSRAIVWTILLPTYLILGSSGYLPSSPLTLSLQNPSALLKKKEQWVRSFLLLPSTQHPPLQRVDKVCKSIRMTKQLFIQLLRFLYWMEDSTSRQVTWFLLKTGESGEVFFPPVFWL